MLNEIKSLVFDREMLVAKTEGTQLFVLRPSKLSKRFKNYDLKKNFQIWLRYEESERAFRPNHLRTMIDLNLRSRSGLN